MPMGRTALWLTEVHHHPMPHPLRYPIYVLSKGRWDLCLSVRFLLRDGVPFRLVVEPAEAEHYAAAFPTADLLITPRDNMRLLGARNFVRDHSTEEGHARHWQLDDNIYFMCRMHRGLRFRMNARIAFAAMETFTDRYTNIGLSGPNYMMFGIGKGEPPYRLNAHIYSCTLINNDMPYRHRLLYNDDTDLCLQVLAGGLCTVQFHTIQAHKRTTMMMKGGNTDDLYRDDGRLRMSRMLERQWPGVVTTTRRFGRPQHAIAMNWRRFDTPLIRRTDIDWDALEADGDGWATAVMV